MVKIFKNGTKKLSEFRQEQADKYAPLILQKYKEIYIKRLMREINSGEIFSSEQDKIDFFTEWEIILPCSYEKASKVTDEHPLFTLGFILSIPAEHKTWRKDPKKYGEMIKEQRPELYETYCEHYAKIDNKTYRKLEKIEKKDSYTQDIAKEVLNDKV